MSKILQIFYLFILLNTNNNNRSRIYLYKSFNLITIYSLFNKNSKYIFISNNNSS